MPLPASFSFASVLLAAAKTANPTVVAADGILCDLTRTLVGDQAKVICLIKPGSDPHTLALRPADRGNLAKAQLVLLNGYNLTPALNKVRTPGIKVKVLLSLITPKIPTFGMTPPMLKRWLTPWHSV